MRRTAILVYGIVCYALFFATFLYAIGFLGNLGVPRSVDVGPLAPLAAAVAIDVVLLSLFAVQHSGMARPAFKRWWTRTVPKPAERATYVLLSSVAMWAIFAYWHPIDAVVWNATTAAGEWALSALFFAGVGLVLYSTMLIDHFELFGVRQVVRHWRGDSEPRPRFVTPSLYRHVRHPLYVGWFVTFWATPTMTLGHLLFAGVCTIYILVAVLLEERDLEGELGDSYRVYRETTPRFVPLPRRRRVGAVPSAR